MQYDPDIIVFQLVIFVIITTLGITIKEEEGEGWTGIENKDKAMWTLLDIVE